MNHGDHTDFRLFKELKGRKTGLTSSGLTRKIFPNTKNVGEFRDKDSFMRARLKQWEKAGAVVAENDGKRSVYKAPEVLAGEGSIFINNGSRAKKRTDGVTLGKVVAVKSQTENKWFFLF